MTGWQVQWLDRLYKYPGPPTKQLYPCSSPHLMYLAVCNYLALQYVTIETEMEAFVWIPVPSVLAVTLYSRGPDDPLKTLCW